MWVELKSIRERKERVLPQYFDCEKKGYRIFEIDFIRGVCILLVLVDHFFFFSAYFGYSWLAIDGFIDTVWYQLARFGYIYWDNLVRIVIRLVVIGIFFFISGISSSFTDNNIKRGLKMLAVAVGLTAFSYLFSYLSGESFYIDFNVIHCFAVCVLLYAALNKSPWWVIVIISLLSIIEPIVIKAINPVIYSKAFLMFGITPPNYNPGDYSSLFPWLAFFLLGGLFGKRFYKERRSLFVDRNRKGLGGILFMGRHSLWFYLISQIAYIAFFAVIGVIMGYQVW